MRFDDYERSHPMRVDLMKIDVEDFEADVLEGMHDTIERDQPFIICEILPRNKEHRNARFMGSLLHGLEAEFLEDLAELVLNTVWRRLLGKVPSTIPSYFSNRAVGQCIAAGRCNSVSMAHQQAD